MSDIVLKVESLYKKYRLGVLSTGTLSHDLNRWWAKVRGKEDPTLKIGENNREIADDTKFVWALEDINFEVKRGEVLGIIGKNGAGKSTLLKILSKVTSPTQGFVKTKGRIASLLEVGTGFHPELTGRENIFLNGAILGMNRYEIKQKLDEIIEFAGVAKYIDTPVKRYSSGMYVRLAFAVAAHLEPEILIIDEVLAVGDAEFQKKCLGKMKDVASEGRTVLFVSHNMASVKSLCTKGLLLEYGKIKLSDEIETVVKLYNQKKENIVNKLNQILPIKNNIYSLEINDIDFEINNQGNFLLSLDIFSEVENKNIGIGFRLKTDEGVLLSTIAPSITGQKVDLIKGLTTISINLRNFGDLFGGGGYLLDVWIAKPKVEHIIYMEDIIYFELPAKDHYDTGIFYESSKFGNIQLNPEFFYKSSQV
jgi:lipopolysaccharide transport system ATP-binding protein